MNTPLTTAEIVERLQLCADDPMWADHAEVSKALLATAASALLALEGERDEARADVKVLNKELYLVRNARDNNADAVRYYETKFEAAEAELAKVRTATVETLSMCERYADFIRTSVKADDIEMHPYLPELEQIIERARAALSEAKAENERLTRERDAFFDKLRQLLCINSVLTALKADAPLWLEHAEKLIDDHNAALSEKTV